MSHVLPLQANEARAAIARLFDRGSPVLVEVRFHNAATAPDWYLYHDEDEFDQLLQRLGSGAEVHLRSVWDLKSIDGGIRLKV